jgi:hypothetical protein
MTMIQRTILLIAIAFILFTGTACSPSQKGSSESLSDSGRVDTSPLTDVFGAWKVVAHYEPGISAMTGTQADAWIGRAALYGLDSALFGDEKCAAATYSVRSIDGDQFYSDFRVKLSDISVGLSRVSIIEVMCAGSDWTAPGGLLVVKSKERMLTLWDGVFFELSK